MSTLPTSIGMGVASGVAMIVAAKVLGIESTGQLTALLVVAYITGILTGKKIEQTWA